LTERAVASVAVFSALKPMPRGGQLRQVRARPHHAAAEHRAPARHRPGTGRQGDRLAAFQTYWSITNSILCPARRMRDQQHVDIVGDFRVAIILVSNTPLISL
jgi:hypothetical protein